MIRAKSLVSQPNLIICPGIHPLELTTSFVRSLENITERNYLILSTEKYAPYDAIAVEQWLKTNYTSPVDAPPLSFICFSAGVVGCIGAAQIWQMQGGKINNFIAFDGWGVPLIADFPIYRVSHDYFTHWSSALMGAGKSSFYAEPEVEHLDLWRSPDRCWGWETVGFGLKTRRLLSDYLDNVLNS